MLHDAVLGHSLLVTLEYVLINIVVQTILAVGIAVLMQRVAKSMVIRGTSAVPVPDCQRHCRAGVVLDARSQHRHRQRHRWSRAERQSWSSGMRDLVIPTIALINVWRYMGYTALLIFAGLQTIPAYVYEAASLDGASESQTFCKITLPLLRPVLVLVLITVSPARSRSSTRCR